MAKVSRITPQETYQKLQAGDVVLVCAYDSEEQFRSLQLDGAISLSEFRASFLLSPRIRKSSFTVPEAASTPLPGWQQNSISKDTLTPGRSWSECRRGSKLDYRSSQSTHERGRR